VSPAPGALCKTLASDLGVAYREADEVIDGESRNDDAKALTASWKRAVERAHTRGEALVLVRATPLTLRWLPQTLASKHLDVSVVPVSSLLQRPAL